MTTAAQCAPNINAEKDSIFDAIAVAFGSIKGKEAFIVTATYEAHIPIELSTHLLQPTTRLVEWTTVPKITNDVYLKP